MRAMSVNVTLGGAEKVWVVQLNKVAKQKELLYREENCFIKQVLPAKVDNS